MIILFTSKMPPNSRLKSQVCGGKSSTFPNTSRLLQMACLILPAVRFENKRPGLYIIILIMWKIDSGPDRGGCLFIYKPDHCRKFEERRIAPERSIMGEKLKNKLVNIGLALFCTALTAAILAMWMAAIVWQDFGASERLGVIIGKATFFVSLYVILRQWLIKSPLLVKAFDAIYKVLRKVRAQYVFRRWWKDYQLQKTCAAAEAKRPKPYCETRF